MRQDKRNKVLLPIIGVFILIVAVTGVSIAFFNYTRTGSPNTLSTGRIYFNSTQNNTLNLTNVFPLTSTQASTANLDAVTVNIEGDTEYTGGVEYLITIDQVNNTVNGKTIPINFIAEVSNTGSIGTSSNDYWNARETKASSIYELTSTGVAENGKQVLVGYIKSGETGISGSITIKAYIDADKIAISDSLENGPIAETGYVNGTTSNWVNGRTVLTTAEWNSLQGAGALSFKIKAVAQEGIWVEEPVPTIPTCPGCVFAYKLVEIDSNYQPINPWTYGENGTVLTSSDYTNNYQTLVTGGHNVFLGMKLDGTGKITNAYACGIKGENPNQGTPFCIEGSTDGSTYTANQSILNPLYGPYDSETGLGYLGGGSFLSCNGSVNAFADATGNAIVTDASSSCVDRSDGAFFCGAN